MPVTEYTVTNIRLPKQDHRLLKRVALAHEQSVGALVRALIREHIAGRAEVRGSRPRRSIWDLPNRARRTGARNLASTIDRIVYG